MQGAQKGYDMLPFAWREKRHLCLEMYPLALESYMRNLTVGTLGEERGWGVGVEERLLLSPYSLKVPFEFSITTMNSLLREWRVL